MENQIGVLNLQHCSRQLYAVDFDFKKSKYCKTYTSTKISHGLKVSLKSKRPTWSSTPRLHLAFANLTESNDRSNNKKAFALTMLPLHRSKIVHLVRHGQGYHNVANTLSKTNYTNWDYEDACLTELGWQQAEALREHVINLRIYPQVELVVVSPLRRTLQTAVGAWGGGPLLNGEAQNSALMLEGVECRNKEKTCAHHAAISSARAPPFIANEWCREQNGNHPCDKRRSISFLKTKFPAIDFSLIKTDEDTWWKAEVRESAEEVYTRARVFLQWLIDRPETRIVVVSHSSFLYHMSHLFGDDLSDVVRRELQQGFRNAEMRTVVIGDRQGGPNYNGHNTNFAGGLNFKEAIAKNSSRFGREIDVPIKQLQVEDHDVPQADDMPTIPQNHNNST